MKKLITFIVSLLISISSFAQIGINYKAVIKDDQGNVISNQEIDMRFSLEFDAGIEFGIITIYQELHTVTTTNNGIVILNIGEGTVISGTFPQDGWNSSDYMITEVDLEQDGTFINLGTTDFKMVPMALSARHAEFAITANSANNVSGLERITESTDTDTGEPIYGWRLVGTDPANHENIGENAVDLSYQPDSTSPGGASGRYSTAIGFDLQASGDFSTALGVRTLANEIGATAIGANTRASGEYSTSIGHFTVASRDLSTAMGYYATASGVNSTAMGRHIQAFSFNETAIGSYNTHYSPISRTSWNGNDKLFVIGNGTSFENRSNALTVLKNGKTGIKTLDPQSLFEVAHQNGAPTSTNLTNAFSLRNLGGDNNANTSDDESWQLYTEDNGYLLLFRNGSFRGAFNATSGAYGQASDRRLKKDITALENGTLNKVMQLNPVSYLMKDQTDTKRNLGLISQEVQALFPSITHYVESQDILSLSYTELIPILIKALQEQQTIIDLQNAKINDQKSTLDSFENDLSKVLKRLENLETANN